jgi:hypothetical protein
MNSDTQREALTILAEVWGLSPDVRLGQLFAHLGFLGEAHVGRGLGDIEDDELFSILCRHRDELLARLAGPLPPSGQPAALTASQPLTPIPPVELQG